MNLTVSGALPSSTSESAQASSGATSSSALLAAPCAVVPGVAGAAGAAGAVEAVGALDGWDPLSLPPPHAATKQAVSKHTMADRIRIMVPPRRCRWRGI